MTDIQATPSSVAARRPKGRPRVLPIPQRKKVSRACDICKQRKMKCNGEQPCLFCQSKSFSCSYKKIDGRTIKNKPIGTNGKSHHVSTDMIATSSSSNSSGGVDSPPTSISFQSNYLPAPPHHMISPSPEKINKPHSSNQSPPPSKISLAVIGRSLQNALANDNDNTTILNVLNNSNESNEGLPNLNGKHTRLLYTQTGDMRFFGESSALSLLSECRSIFKDTLGPSSFTNDPGQEYIIDESSDFTQPCTPVQLPPKELAVILVDLFKTNINDTFYVFNMDYFNTVIFQRTYDNPSIASTRCLCLLNLVFAIGALFAEYTPNLNLNIPKSTIFLRSGQALMRSNVYDGKLWMVEANFLKYFYYQSCCNRSSSWINLGTAIRLGQALGLHRKIINSRFAEKALQIHRRRLWRSLYVCDCVSSVNLGRPLLVSGYDYDDSNYEIYDDTVSDEEKLRIVCQKLTSDSAVINGRIVENIFKDGRINIKRTHLLSMELKIWSKQLPQQLQLNSDLEKQLEQGKDSNNYLLVFVHLGQLYGIMALTRPFLVYVVTRKLKPETKSQITDEQSLMSFCKACIKASFLVIKLLRFYSSHNPDRKEVFTIQSACFFASIILGFTLLEQRKSSKPDEHYMEVLREAIKDGRETLKTYASFNHTCNRWAEHLEHMLQALDTEASDMGSTYSLSSEIEQFNNEMINWANESKGLEEILNFQSDFAGDFSGERLEDLLGMSMGELSAFRYDTKDHIVFGDSGEFEMSAS
ncbi:Filamentous growth regulator 27 [Spathaspora sp. JA1]|nr:Filamentous growth regulator 27 [Spathaspora sp. JA1]